VQHRNIKLIFLAKDYPALDTDLVTWLAGETSDNLLCGFAQRREYGTL
jgi:hypothetical protein